MKSKIFKDDFRYSFLRNGETELVFEHAPVNWNASPIKFVRVSEIDSLSTSYSDEFEPVLEAREYLKKIFEDEFMKGLNPVVQFKVEKFNTNTFKYEHFFISDVDFFSLDFNSDTVAINTVNQGLESRINANFNTVYEYDLSDFPSSDVRNIEYDRLILQNIANLAIESKFIGTQSESQTILSLGSSVINQEIPSGFLLINDASDGGSTTEGDDNFILKYLGDDPLLVNIDISISGSINGTMQATPPLEGNIDFSIHIGTSVSTTNPDNIVYSGKSMGTINQTVNVNKQFTFTLYKGVKIYLVRNIMLIANSANLNIDLSGYLNITFSKRSENKVFIPAVRPSALLGKMINQLAGGIDYNIDLSYLRNSDFNNRLITSGNYIRGIEDAKIKISLSDLRKHLRVTCGIGYGYRMNEAGVQTFYVDDIKKFYRKNEHITHLDKIKNYHIKPDYNNIYNQIDVGYKDQNINDINGKFDIHSTSSFAIEKSDCVEKKLDYVSPIIASCYAIEYLLLDYEKNPTTDSEKDNDNFVFHVYPNASQSGNYRLNRYLEVLNHPAKDSMFNLALTPKRNMLLSIDMIKSYMMLAGLDLEFASSKKDFNATTQHESGTDSVVEFSRVWFGYYNNNPFNMIHYEFVTMVDESVVAKLQTTGGYGYVSFVDDEGRILKGFVEEVSVNPATDEEQTWKLRKLVE